MTFVSWGELFGLRQIFRSYLALPIEKGRERDASDKVRRQGDEANGILQGRLEGHVLARYKIDTVTMLQHERGGFGAPVPAPDGGSTTVYGPQMAAKTEVVLWCRMVDQQVINARFKLPLWCYLRLPCGPVQITFLQSLRNSDA